MHMHACGKKSSVSVRTETRIHCARVGVRLADAVANDTCPPVKRPSHTALRQSHCFFRPSHCERRCRRDRSWIQHIIRCVRHAVRVHVAGGMDTPPLAVGGGGGGCVVDRPVARGQRLHSDAPPACSSSTAGNAGTAGLVCSGRPLRHVDQIPPRCVPVGTSNCEHMVMTTKVCKNHFVVCFCGSYGNLTFVVTR
jgi:hypothetical protein